MPLKFSVAAARLNELARGCVLLPASRAAYGEGVSGLMRVGPVPGVSRLVRVQAGEPFRRSGSMSLPVRWQVEGIGGRLFPMLDADISVHEDGDQTIVRIDGVYRPPLGRVGVAFDRAVLHTVADATIRRFLTQVTGLLTSPQTEPAPAACEMPVPEPGIA